MKFRPLKAILWQESISWRVHREHWSSCSGETIEVSYGKLKELSYTFYHQPSGPYTNAINRKFGTAFAISNSLSIIIQNFTLIGETISDDMLVSNRPVWKRSRPKKLCWCIIGIAHWDLHRLLRLRVKNTDKSISRWRKFSSGCRIT